PCRVFRPHAGWRTGQMYAGLERIDHKLVGWGWMLWDWNWFRPRTPDSIIGRVGGRVSAGDIVVMHDRDEKPPPQDQPQTLEATARLIPLLRSRGFSFGTVCGSRSVDDRIGSGTSAPVLTANEGSSTDPACHSH